MRFSIHAEGAAQANDQDQAGVDQGLQKLLGTGSTAVIIRLIPGQ